jgi:hypothetical protein
MLSLEQIIKTQFGNAGIYKIPSNERTDDLSPQGEQGIVVGYEPAHPSNLKIFVPERGCIVIRNQHHVIPVTSELGGELSDSFSDGASPTTDITSVFVALNICSYFDCCRFYTGNIPAAY